MKWVDSYLVSGFHLFLYTGITFANFNLSGTVVRLLMLFSERE